ncbi:hypothetical protein [Natronoglycomyces albus]|uniref:Uncharacterized protein n=1 Tax=Natronoglycomyces albus TaxID=2811108 RepID=A0A895XLK5_9ACTN|nr:hypothetical protein [Natronoglycomyces albus]QSB04299.1 hypothetical protein JQS30_10860 [Natronoglycomyces albus]
MKFRCRLVVEYRVTGAWTAASMPQQEVRERVLRYASQITESLRLTRAGDLRERINFELGSHRDAAGVPLRYGINCVNVMVDEDEVETVRRIVDIKRDVALQPYLDERVKARMNFYGETLSTSRTAALWWLAENPSNVEQLPHVARVFNDFISLTDNAPQSDGAGDFLAEFFAHIRPNDQEAFGHFIRQLIDRAGSPDADVLLKRWEELVQNL